MSRSNTHWILWVGVLVLSLAGCERTIHVTSGDFHGLSIGMSKADAIVALSQQGVEVVEPEVDAVVVIDQASISRLPKLIDSDGWCIRSSSQSVHIAFDRSGNSSLVYSSVDSEISRAFNQRQTKSQALNHLKVILLGYPDVVVTNCVLGIRHIRVKNPQRSDLDNLYNFDSWLYFLPSSFSYATIHFKGDKLNSIDYVNRAYEVP